MQQDTAMFSLEAIIFSGCGILMAVGGFLIKEKKMYNLMSGYNSMNEEQKSKVNVKKIAENTGIGLYILAVLWTAFGILAYISPTSITIITIGILCVCTVFTVIVLLILCDEANKPNIN